MNTSTIEANQISLPFDTNFIQKEESTNRKSKGILRSIAKSYFHLTDLISVSLTSRKEDFSDEL